MLIVTDSVPLVALVPDHEPDAVQDVELVEAQAISTLPPIGEVLRLFVKDEITAAIAATAPVSYTHLTLPTNREV